MAAASKAETSRPEADARVTEEDAAEAWRTTLGRTQWRSSRSAASVSPHARSDMCVGDDYRLQAAWATVDIVDRACAVLVFELLPRTLQ